MIHATRTSFSIRSTDRNQKQRTPVAYYQYHNGIWTVVYGEDLDSPDDTKQMKDFDREMEKLRRDFILKNTRSEQYAKNSPPLGCFCLGVIWYNKPMKKIIFFLINLLAVSGGLTFMYASITGGDVLMAKIVEGEWGRILNGIVGIAIFMSVFTRIANNK